MYLSKSLFYFFLQIFKQTIWYTYTKNSMNIFQLILFVLLFTATNGHWFLKRPNTSKPVSYPSPGKRSLPDDQFDSIATDCSQSYSELRSTAQKAKWLLRCIYAKMSQAEDDNSRSSDSNDISLNSLLKSRSSSRRDRSLESASPTDESFNRLLLKLMRGRMMKKWRTALLHSRWVYDISMSAIYTSSKFCAFKL